MSVAGLRYERAIVDLGDADGRPPCDPPNGCVVCLVVLEPTNTMAIRAALRADPWRFPAVGQAVDRDAVVIAALTTSWATATTLADRLGMSLNATYQALYRVERRHPDAIEHQHGLGYRRPAS